MRINSRRQNSRRKLPARLMLPPLFILIIIAAGCSFKKAEYHAVSHYDIDISPPLELPGQKHNLSLTIGRFSTLGPYDQRMVYRKSEHRLVRDEYNRWIQAPADLARQAFYRAFNQANMFDSVRITSTFETDLRLTADIVRWETSPKLEAAIEIIAHIESKHDGIVILSRRYLHNEKLTAATPEAFAAATSNALRQIAVSILQDFIQTQ